MARRTIDGYEAMHIIRKGQIMGVSKDDVLELVKFVQGLFGIAA